MANFLIVIDTNESRRQQFLSAVNDRLAPLPGLERGALACGHCSIVWAKGRNTPASQCQRDDSVALLLGDALSENGRTDAEQLSRSWQPRRGSLPAPLDGYFAGMTYNVRDGLCVGVDLLGMFPVYYVECRDVLLVASSPDLFVPHPLFPAAISPAGLAGIMLTNGLVDNQSLLDGVRRLEAGHLLRGGATAAVREERQYCLPCGDRFMGVRHRELERVVEATFEDVLDRHAPDQPTALLLSGGLDSRLMAGYLCRHGCRPAALNLGLPTDFEFLAARRVAAALKLPFTGLTEEPTDEMYVEFALRTARCEMLSGGFSMLDMWSAATALAPLAPRFWSGILLDDLLGGKGIHNARDPKTGRWSLDRFFARMSTWAMPPDPLSELLSPLAGRDLVSEVSAAHRHMTEHGQGYVWQQAFYGKLSTRCRFHLGAGLWRLSFGSWPVAPFLDRRLLELAIDLPPSLVLGRRWERHMLVERFPDLARIPLDNGSMKFRPPVRDVPGRLAGLAGRAVPHRLRHRLRWGAIERRRYVRHFDLNQRHWQAIRRGAEPYRRTLCEWLDGRVVDQLLPPPDAPIALGDPCGPGASRRNLLGLMLCSQQLSIRSGKPTVRVPAGTSARSPVPLSVSNPDRPGRPGHHGVA